MRYAIATVAAALTILGGCAGQQNVRSENAALKAQVSALQTQVADLRAENAKLTASALAPLAIDGLKLEPPKLGELRFTPAPATATLGGSGSSVLAVGQNVSFVSGYINAGTLEPGALINARPTTFQGTITTWERAHPAGGILWDDRNGVSPALIKSAPATTKDASTTRP
jgi:hypothetical protein